MHDCYALLNKIYVWDKIFLCTTISIFTKWSVAGIVTGACVELCRESYAKAVEFINRVGKQH